MPTALPSEYVAALELMFRHAPPAEAMARIRNALPLLKASGEQGLRLLVARGDSGLRAALMVQALPGGGGEVWPPQGRPDAEDELLHEALAWLRSSGIRLAQAILRPEDAPLSAPLRRAGFTRPTRLRSLRHSLNHAQSGGSLSYQTYRDGDRDAFRHTLARTFTGTRDFPEMNGVRTVEDVIRGHLANDTDLARWRLASADGDPAGVLVLSPGDGDGVELSYVGVVPELRGRGYGRELVVKALDAARACGAAELTLGVDERNDPARRLYRSLGFEEYEVRDVYLRVDHHL